MVCVSLFLHIKIHYPEALNNTICNIAVAEKNVTSREKAAARFFLQRDDIPQAIKSHVHEPDPRILRNSTVVFTTAVSKTEANQTLANLAGKGFNVGLVQDKETLARVGLRWYIQQYAEFFNLTSQYITLMDEYFQDWDKLRQCCGMQMSKYFKNELLPASLKKVGMKQHQFCGEIDINEIKNHFINNELYQLLDGYTLVRRINRPSVVNGNLDGTYCLRYNEAVRRTHTDGNKTIQLLNYIYPDIENHFYDKRTNPLGGLEHHILNAENKPHDSTVYGS
ncbi:hypothetical protein HJC23_007347 [Cyclotella cryptica]|uniref:Uncharacterized protein n=1 Tax=Cyclotella cryptica TaxID=29204 RepID=A0ABD3PES8_9STRA|eukprot:CCRYP_015763-RA/>CCRYP_015763-RA protein AED:0.18 eAED:0.18 QI:0/-1/0/1/-1/1/1/0/279